MPEMLLLYLNDRKALLFCHDHRRTLQCAKKKKKKTKTKEKELLKQQERLQKKQLKLNKKRCQLELQSALLECVRTRQASVAIKNLKIMLNDRGYVLHTHQDDLSTSKPISLPKAEQLPPIKVHIVTQQMPNKTINTIVAVQFCVRVVARAQYENGKPLVCILHDSDNGSFGVGSIRLYFAWLHEQKIARVIFILEKHLTKQAIAAAENVLQVSESDLECEFFLFSELALIAKNHYLVPLHETIPKAEEEALLERLQVKRSALPKIRLCIDPIARYFGNRRNDIVRITSMSYTAGTATSFARIVA